MLRVNSSSGFASLGFQGVNVRNILIFNILTETGDDSKLVHRRIWPKVDANIFSLFPDVSELRVWLSAESKILASTFGRCRLYRLIKGNFIIFKYQIIWGPFIVSWAKNESYFLDITSWPAWIFFLKINHQLEHFANHFYFIRIIRNCKPYKRKNPRWIYTINLKTVMQKSRRLQPSKFSKNRSSRYYFLTILLAYDFKLL